MRAIVLLLLLLAACTSRPVGSASVPSSLDRIAAECALLARAAEDMAATGAPADPGLREGCPGETARDARPLSRQTASLRAATGAALPPSVAAGTRAEAVFRRMLTRGVPVSVALRLVDDPAFAAAVR
ncbi:MAG: hypothetical protein H6898_17230 [Rhodobacter sp.]|nr:hypothetical protein [Paracoccaceae bacterium]MCC0078301.1 hypothetical protein [Rhodobacter sp.]